MRVRTIRERIEAKTGVESRISTTLTEHNRPAGTGPVGQVITGPTLWPPTCVYY